MDVACTFLSSAVDSVTAYSLTLPRQKQASCLTLKKHSFWLITSIKACLVAGEGNFSSAEIAYDNKTHKLRYIFVKKKTSSGMKIPNKVIKNERKNLNPRHKNYPTSSKYKPFEWLFFSRLKRLEVANEKHHRNLLSSSSDLNDHSHTVRLHPQAQKLEPLCTA